MNDVIVIDDFYPDPDSVVNYALSQKFSSNIDSNWPGKRPPKMDDNCDIVISFLNLLKNKTNVDVFNYDLETSFHKTYIFSSFKNSSLNSGFVHTDLYENYFIDGKKTLSGVVYLNKKSIKSSGTSFYKLKNYTNNISDPSTNKKFADLRREYDYYFNAYKNMLYSSYIPKPNHAIDIIKIKDKFDDLFEKTHEIDNVYNRLILYNSNYFHSASNLFCNDFDPRLTQVFFMSEK